MVRAVSLNVKWFDLLQEVAEETERIFKARGADISVCIQKPVIEEIDRQIARSLELDGIERANAAKIAGLAAFWIRKLKPLYVEPLAEPFKTYSFINELVSLQVGASICNHYFSDNGLKGVRVNSRVMKDWLVSLRYHSHSPHSSMIAFEMLASEQ